MIQINRVNVRMWSMLSSRGTFGTTILALSKEDDNLLVLSADLGNSSGLDRFKSKFPNKFINVGIAEQNMIGIAAGLANEGMKVFCTTFAPFATMRACEQVRNHMGYMGLNIKLVGLASGFATGILGNSHYGLEDVAIMRSIPNITIISPADSTETAKATAAIFEYDGPVYLRLTGTANNPIVYKSDYDFEIGKAITLKSGEDITIISSGTMVNHSLKAARMLEEQGLSCSVINIHTIKPLDTEIINAASKSSKLIVSIEEHSKIGGLGGAIAEHLSSLQNSPQLLRLGIEDKFRHAGDYGYMLNQNDLQPEQISKNIENKYKSLITK
jgi:transketolase